MKILRWLGGLLIIVAFIYFNFFVYNGEILIKIINVGLFCALFVLVRVVFGPSPADRIVAVEILGILIVGILGILAGGVFLINFIDHGSVFHLLSAGTIPLLNIIIGIKVGVSLFLVVYALSELKLEKGEDL